MRARIDWRRGSLGDERYPCLVIEGRYFALSAASYQAAPDDCLRQMQEAVAVLNGTQDPCFVREAPPG